jgi:trehalose 6-phosphate phosphatase
MADLRNASSDLVEMLRNRPDQFALFLDFDGTLVDLATTPEAVIVPSMLPDHLDQLSRSLRGAMAIVTGREIVEIDRFLNRADFVVAGSHGATTRIDPHAEPIMAQGALMLDKQLRDALTQSAIRLGCLAEDKEYSVALHYRKAPESAVQLKMEIDALLSSLPVSARPSVMTGKMVYEVKFDTYNKGTALDCLMKRAPFAGRRPVFIGDDTTDVYGFEQASALGGVGFSVGRVMQHATAMFDSAQAVRDAIAKGVSNEGRE